MSVTSQIKLDTGIANSHSYQSCKENVFYFVGSIIFLYLPFESRKELLSSQTGVKWSIVLNNFSSNERFTMCYKFNAPRIHDSMYTFSKKHWKRSSVVQIFHINKLHMILHKHDCEYNCNYDYNQSTAGIKCNCNYNLRMSKIIKHFLYEMIFHLFTMHFGTHDDSCKWHKYNYERSETVIDLECNESMLETLSSLDDINRNSNENIIEKTRPDCRVSTIADDVYKKNGYFGQTRLQNNMNDKKLEWMKNCMQNLRLPCTTLKFLARYCNIYKPLNITSTMHGFDTIDDVGNVDKWITKYNYEYRLFCQFANMFNKHMTDKKSVKMFRNMSSRIGKQHKQHKHTINNLYNKNNNGNKSLDANGKLIEQCVNKQNKQKKNILESFGNINDNGVMDGNNGSLYKLFKSDLKKNGGDRKLRKHSINSNKTKRQIKNKVLQMRAMQKKVSKNSKDPNFNSKLLNPKHSHCVKFANLINKAFFQCKILPNGIKYSKNTCHNNILLVTSTINAPMEQYWNKKKSEKTSLSQEFYFKNLMLVWKIENTNYIMTTSFVTKYCSFSFAHHLDHADVCPTKQCIWHAWNHDNKHCQRTRSDQYFDTTNTV